MLDSERSLTQEAIAARRAAEALANQRGFASDGSTYKERTGEKPITEKAQDALESAGGTVINIVSGGLNVLDILAENWKLVLIAVIGMLIILKD